MAEKYRSRINRGVMEISSINIYTLKSSGQQTLEQTEVIPDGLRYDRKWILVDRNKRAITAREHPKLMKVVATQVEDQLQVRFADEEKLFARNKENEIAIGLFKETVGGVAVSEEADDWFSSLLGIPCQLLFQAPNLQREVLSRRGGKPGDIVNYADEAPILLLGESALNHLNSLLATPISMRHFRPNLVFSGGEPHTEDHWKLIEIGNCRFEVIQACQRCIMTTINPDSLEKDSKQEPLRTLAGYRSSPGGGVVFGVHLIPRKLGKIRLGDSIRVIQ